MIRKLICRIIGHKECVCHGLDIEGNTETIVARCSRCSIVWVKYSGPIIPHRTPIGCGDVEIEPDDPLYGESL